MKVVVLNSGGKDSLATIKLLRRTKGYHLVSLYLHVGHQNDSECAAQAKRVADAYCDEHHELVLEGIPPVMNRWGFLATPHQTFVFAVLAAAWARARSIYAIASGFRRHDELEVGAQDDKLRGLFPDTTIITPVAALTDVEVRDIVKDDPLWLTTLWCHSSPPCGSCIRCQARAKIA